MNSLLDFKKIEKISKALGDTYRLKIVEAVRKQEDFMWCKDIIELLGISQPTVSHHLKLLVDAELLIAEKDGRSTKYFINKEVFAGISDYLRSFDQ